MNVEEIVEKVLEDPLKVPGKEHAELLIEHLIEVFKNTPQLIEKNCGKTVIVGDTHGDVYSSMKAFDIDADCYVFLGDYVDRGPHQLENMFYIMAQRVKYPDKVVILRGNHESPLMNKAYGFYSLVLRKYGGKIYRKLAKMFANMSYAVLINNSVLGIHGGIARNLENIEEIIDLPKNDIIPSNQVAFELLWNDPSEEIEWFEPNIRGEGTFYYGRKALDTFLEKNGLSKIVRAHEAFFEGYKVMFEGRLWSIFSCRYYPIKEPVAAFLRENGEIKIKSLA